MTRPGPTDDKVMPLTQADVPRKSQDGGPTVGPSFVPPTVAINGKKFSYRKPAETSTPSAGPTEANARLKYRPGKWDIWMLGITIVIGGQYFCWNAGLAAGLYSYMIGVFFIGTAYITLCCCTSEITGSLPFAGGAYGLARCTLGFYPAFMIGCCEALEYIAYVSTSVISFTDMVVSVAPHADTVRPLVWAAFYISALYFHIKGDRVFWIFNLVIGSISIAIVVLFAFGSLGHVDFGKNAVHQDFQFTNGMPGFMKSLPLACWFFVGVEALNLASDQVPQPKQIVPFAQIACVCTLAVSAVFVFFITVSLPPGISELPGELVPFNNGFEPMFNISHTNATILSLPATYATAFGFIWCYGKLIAAMATSKLLPVFLARTTNRSGTPYMAIICGSALSYVICLVVYVAPSVSSYLFNICITAAFFSYTGQCVGYISLKLNYRNIRSSYFRNPFGIPGALYSLSVWVLCLISIVGFQGNGGIEIMIFGIVVVLLSIYYYAWAKRRQTFSAAENRILLVAHVMKFNGRRTAAHKGGNKSGSGNKSTQHNNTSRHTNNESTHHGGKGDKAKANTTSKTTAATSKRTGKSSGW